LNGIAERLAFSLNESFGKSIQGRSAAKFLKNSGLFPLFTVRAEKIPTSSG
jgi:hypothetical protein